MPRPLYRIKRRLARRRMRDMLAGLVALQLGTGGAGAQVVADGRTATSVSHAGGVTDVHTSTIAAGHGVNTFSSFSTATGSLTNIHVPTGAAGTVNIVTGPASVIAGAVHSVQGGTVGGALYFANSAGVVVGPGGSFTAGSVALSTPSQDFAAGIVGPNGAVSGGHVEALIAGTAPLSGADVVVDGTVHGASAVRIRAGGDIVIGGAVTAGSRAATMGAAVNMGAVSLQAGGDVRLQGGGRVEGQAGASGGHVTVRAGGSIRVATGAVMLAEGEGAGAGGTIDVFGADSAFIEPGGLVSVVAHGTGDGGFVEYSATRVVEVEGALRAWSAGGQGGTVFIDPEHLTISGEISGGATFSAEATASITVASGAIISTRKVSGDASDEEHVTTESTGNSGDIRLTAPNITIEAEALLLAFADNGYDGGNIILTAKRIDREGHLTQALPVSSASIIIERAYLRAADIVITAETAKFNQVDAEGNINAYLDGLIPDGLPLGLTETLVDLGQQAASRAQATLDAVNYDNWPSYLSARAEIGVNRSTLHADGQIRITSTARTETEITPETGGMALVIAASNTVARSIVTNSVLVAEGDVTITSDTLVEQRLRAEGVPGGGLTGLNTALVASVRMGGAETVLGGVPSAPVWSTRHFLPDGIEMNNNAVIQTGGAVTLGAVNTTDLSLVADTKLGENGRGASIVLSLDDRAAVTAAGGEIWSNPMALDIHARNLYRTVLIEARVTGGAMEADDAPTDAVAGQPDAQQDVMAGVLGGVAASAEGGSGVGQAAGITDATQGGEVADRAYAASFALANHNASARVVLGDDTYEISRPGGGTALMRGLALLPMGGSFSGSAVIPPTITRDYDPQPGAITILAENVLEDVRQRAIAAAGTVPEPGQDPETAAKRTGLVAVSFADWDLDAEVSMGSLTGSGWITQIAAGAGITITARNVAPDFADRDALDEAHDLYSGKRQAESPVEDAADEDETGEGEGTGTGGGDTGEGETGEGGTGEGATGEGDTGEGDGDDTAPNAGGLLGAWSDGEGPLFSRAGEDDDDPLALSVAQTFAAGEALGVGISLARLSGDQTARVDLGRNVWILADKEPLGGLEVETPGETVIRAVQRGAWGASAGAPGQATGAGEGGAYGASIALVNIEATTETLLRDGALLSGTDNDTGATVTARDTRLLSADARTHGAAGKTSFSGALSLMQRRDTTRALIAPLARLELDGTLTIRAENTGDTVTVVSAAAAGKTSIGVGIALTFADRETVAGLVGPDVLEGASVFNTGTGDLGGLEIVAESTGNVISGGRTQAGEADEATEAPEPGEGAPGEGQAEEGSEDGEAEEDDTEAPVALDAEAIGEGDSTRVADAIGGANPLTGGGGGGGGNDDGGGLAFAGDFGAIFADVTTEAMIVGRDNNFDNDTRAIDVDVEGGVTVSARTAISYGQSSAVTAAASGGVGISGSFGLTFIEHDTAARMIDSEIFFGPHYADEDKTLRPVRITSADESRFDLLVDGRAGRADGGWSFAIAASFARFVTRTETELTRSTILLGTAGVGGGFDEGGEFDEGGFGEELDPYTEIDGGDGWFYNVFEGGWYRSTSTDRWVYVSDGGWNYDMDRGWVFNEGGFGWAYRGEGDALDNLPDLADFVGPARDLSPDGREIVISSVADPTLTIRATSERTGPTAGGGNGNGGNGGGGNKADQADAQQMEGVGTLVRDAGAEARKDKGEGGLKGLSITVAPLRQIADANVLIDRSLIEAQLQRDGAGPGEAGKVEITSRARTNVDIDARSDTIAIAIAITDTLSHVRIRRSLIDAEGSGTVAIVSRAEELHRLRATAGAERAIKAAGVLSLRNLENRVLMDAEASGVPSWSDRTTVTNRIRSGESLLIAARTDRDIDIEVIAADGTPSAVALAAIISLADAETEVAVGAGLFQDGGEAVVIEAINTWTRYSARAIASAGTFVPGAEIPTPPEPDPDADPDATPDEEPAPERDPAEVGTTATALLDVAEDVEAEVETPEAEGEGEEDEGEAQPDAQPRESAARKRSFAIAFALDLHNDTTLARIGDVRMDGDTPVQVGASSVRGWNDLGGAGLQLVAENRMLSFTRETRAAIGFGDAATPGAGVFAVGIGNWRVETDAGIGYWGTVRADTVTIRAATVLPGVSAELDRAGWFDDESGLFERGAGGYASGDERPKSADELVEEDGWNIVTSTHTDAQKLGVAVDVSISRVVSETSARLEGRIGAAGEGLTIEARTEGGFASRRDPEGNTTLTSGGSGAGGSGHVLLFRPETRAILAPDRARDGALGDVTVTARNDMVAAVAASSFGKAEKFGLNIGFALIDYNGTAEALVVNPDRMSASSLTVEARDSSLLLADAGSSTAGEVSVGVSGAIIFADRTVTAELWSTEDEALSLGDIRITALEDGSAVATSVAGAGLADEDELIEPEPDPDADPDKDPEEEAEPATRSETPVPTQLLGSRTETNADDLGPRTAETTPETDGDETPDAAKNSPAEGKEFGFAFAGDFSGIFGASVVRAGLVHGGRVDGGNVDVTADTTGAIFASAGSAVGGAGNIGLAGSAALNGTRRTTRARLDVADLQLTEGLVRVTAQDATDLRLMAAGRGGAAVRNSVLGSAAVDFGRITVSADITGGVITQAAGDGSADAEERGITVRARNAGRSLTLAGALKETEEEQQQTDPQQTGTGGAGGAGGAGGTGGGQGEGSGTTPQETPPGGGDGEGGFAVGVAFAGNLAREEITASSNAFISAPSVRVFARSVGRVDGIAASTGGASTFSLTGAAVVTAFRRHVEASVTGGEISTESLDVRASDRSDSRLRVGSDSETGDVSIGAAGVFAIDNRTVIARIANALTEELGSTFPTVTVSARQEGNVELVQTGGGTSSDEGIAGSIGVGVLLARRTTQALIEDSNISAGDVTVIAAQEGNLRNRQGISTNAGNGGSIGVIVTALRSDLAARMTGGSLVADEATITATEESRLLSRATKTGAAENSIDVMVATATLSGSLVAEVDGAFVNLPNLTITARDESGVQAAAIARASSSGFGATGGVAYAANRLDVGARLVGRATGGGLFVSDTLTVAAVGESTLTGTVVGLNMAGGDFAGSLQVAWLTANRDVIATASGDDWASSNVTVTARRADTLLGIGATAQEGAASVGIAGNVLQTGGRTLAGFQAGGASALGGTLTVRGEDESRALNIAVGAAAGGGFSAVGSLAYIQMGRKPADAVAEDADDQAALSEGVTEAVRDDLAEDFAGTAGLDVTDLQRRFDLAIEARVEVADGGSLTVARDTRVHALDNRVATAVAGQLTLSFDTGGAAEKALDLLQIDENGVRLDIKAIQDEGTSALMNFALFGGGGSDEDAGISEGAGQASGRPEAGGDGGGDAGGDGDSGGSFSVGASMAWVRIGGLVAADVVLGNGAALTLGAAPHDTEILARSTAKGAGISVGAMAGDGTGIGAGAGISRHNQTVRASLTGAGAADSTVTSGALRVISEADGRSWAIAGQATIGVGQGSSVGGTLAVSSLDARALAVIDSVTVDNRTSSVAPVSATARDDSRSLALALTGAVSVGGSAVGVSVGVNRARGLARAEATGATILTPSNVAIIANRNQRMNSFVMQLSLGLSGAGVGAAVAISDQRGGAEAEVIASTVEARSLRVLGNSESRLSSATVGAAVGGSVGVSGSVSVITRADVVAARIVDSAVEAADTVLVQALAGGSMGGAGGGDSQVAADLEETEVAVAPREADEIAAEDSANVRRQLGAANVNIAVGGSVGIGVSVAVLRTAAHVTAEIVDSDVIAHLNPPTGNNGVDAILREEDDGWLLRRTDRRTGIIVQADNQTRLRALGITAAVSSGVGASLQVPVLMLRDSVAARVVDSTLRSGSDVLVNAGNQSDIGTLSVVIAGGGSVGAGALVEVGSLAKQTRAEVLGGSVEAARDIDVIAVSPEVVRKLAIAAGAGGAAGIAGAVETFTSRNETEALVGAASLTAGRDVAIEALSPRSIVHAAGTVAAGGLGGVAGTVMVIQARDRVIAATNDAFTPETATTLDIGRDLTVRARAELTARTTMISGAFGGAVGIGGQVLVSSFNQRVQAQIGDNTRLVSAVRDVTVHAEQRFAQKLVMGAMGGGGVAAIGGTVGVTNIGSTVSAEIGQNVTLTATRDVSVVANGARDLDAVAVAGSAAGLVALQATVLVASFAGSVEDEDNVDTLNAVEGDLAGDPYDGMDAGNPFVRGLLSEAREDRSDVDLSEARRIRSVRTDVVRAGIGQNTTIIAGNAIEVRSFEGGEIRMIGGAAAVAGVVGVSAGVVVLTRRSGVNAFVASGSSLTAAGVLISAEGSGNDGNMTAFAMGAAGLLGGGAAVGITNIDRQVTTTVGDAQIDVGTGLVTISAREVGEARANVVSAAAGTVGVGVTVTRTERSSLVRTTVGATISSGSTLIAALRDGDTMANGVAAAGGLAVSGAAALATVRDASDVSVDLGSADITALDSITIRGTSTSALHATTTGVSVAGGVAIGYSKSVAELESRTEVIGSPTLRAEQITVTATTAGRSPSTMPATTVLAEAEGSAGGKLAAGQGVVTEARSSAVTRVDIGLQVQQATGLMVLARSDVQVDARSRGDVASFGLALGSTVSTAVNASEARTDVNVLGSLDVFGDVDIRAIGRDRTLGQSVSGNKSFGAALQAARTSVEVRPTTVTILRGGPVAALGTVTVASDRDSQFAAEADSRFAAVAGRSGARLFAFQDADIATRIESDITAATINILANQRLAKSVDQFNARTTVGSILSGSSIESATTVLVSAAIDIRPGVTLRQVSSPLVPGGGVLVALTQDIDIADRLSQNLDTGGYGRPSVDSSVLVLAAELDVPGGLFPFSPTGSTVTIDNAVIDADADIIVANRSDVRVTSEGYVGATGASAAPKGVTEAVVRLGQDMVLTGGGTRLTSRTGSVRLLSGRELDRGQVVAANAETRLWNATDLRFRSNADALGRVVVDTNLTIAPNVSVTAARDVELWADPGRVDHSAYWAISQAARPLWLDLQPINPVFGADFVAESIGAYNDMSVRISEFSRRIDALGTLDVRGVVTAGAFGIVRVTIDRDGNVDTEGNDEAVRVRIEEGAQRNAALIAYIASLVAQKDALLEQTSGVRTAEVQRLEFEIASLESRLEVQGGAAARGDLIVVDPITAAGGNIDIRAGAVTGNGVLTANGDATIDITNLSDMSMEVRGAHIPFRDAGRIRVNDVRVTSNAGVAAATPFGTGTPSLTLNSSDGEGRSSAIRLRGEHIATAGGLPADLIVTGDIENLTGLVEITTLDGSVLIFGADIAAKSVLVNSGGDFFLGAADAFSSPVRNPAGLYRSFFETFENLSLQEYAAYESAILTGTATSDFAIDRTTPGTIRALGSVFIYADTLNIDGTIQAGETNWTLDIAEGFAQRLQLLTEAEIAGRDRILVYDAFNTGAQLGKELSDEMVVLPGLGSFFRPYVTGNATVFYNVAEGTLEVEPMLTKGGTIEIVGRILSTGGLAGSGRAQLIAAHGYGHIDVTNASRLPIVLTGMNTGVEPVEGRISITDLGNLVVPGGVCFSPSVCTTDPVFRTTTWRRVSGGVVTTATAFDPNTGNVFETETLSTNVSNIWYDIAEPWAVEIVRGLPLALGAEGQYDSIRLLFDDEQDWMGSLPHAYRRQVLTDRFDDTPGNWVFHTHMLRADYPIQIRFAGHESGRIEIDSVGDVRIAGPVQNTTGPTRIFATGFTEAGNLVPQAGNIVTLRPDIPIVLGRTDLEAAGDIAGASFASLIRTVGTTPWGQPIRAGTTLREDTGFARIEIAEGESLRATSGYGQILLQQGSGDLHVRLVAGPVVRLQAPGSILDANDLVLAPFTVSASEALDLVAGSGTIGTAANPLIVRGGPARIDAEADGDIHLRGVLGSLGLGEVRSRTGDVFVTADGFSILDRNPEEEFDRRAAAGLLEALWDELGLRETDEGTHLARIDSLADAVTAAELADYLFYWEQRLEAAADPRDAPKDLGYDPSFTFVFKGEELADLLAAGADAEFFEEEEARLTAAYHAIHARFGDQPFNPKLVTGLDEAGRQALLAEALFSDDQLRRGIREDLILDVTDTRFRIEAPNVIGRNATLIATQDIGREDGTIVINRGDRITDEALLALASAERGDITRLDDGSLVIRVLEDVDVELAGRLIAQAGGNALIGSEGALLLDRVSGNALVRVKVTGDLLQADTGDGVTGREVVLESALGGIGREDVPLFVATPLADAALDARAAEGIFLMGAGDLRLGRLFTPSTAGVTVSVRAGDILRADNVTGSTIRAPALSLAAPEGNIGRPDGSGAPLLEALEGGVLPLTLASAGTTAFDIAAGSTVILPGFAPAGDTPRSLRIGGGGRLELTGDIALQNGGDIVLAAAEMDLRGEIFTRAGDITLTLPEHTDLGNVSSGGGTISITGMGDLGILGVIDAADGNLELIVERALTTDAATLLRAPNGRLSLTLWDDRAKPATQPLRTEIAGLEVFAYSLDFAIQNTAPVLTLGNLSVEAFSAQIGTSGQMVLDGDIWVGYPDWPDTTLLLVAGEGLRGMGSIEAGRAFLYALDGGIGAAGDPLTLGMGETGMATIAALGGDVVLDLPAGLTADVVTASQGNVLVSSSERIRVNLVGSLAEPDMRVAAGSEIGPWGGPAFDVAQATGLGDALLLAGLDLDAAVPGPDAPKPGDDDDTKPGDDDDTGPGEDDGQPDQAGDDAPGRPGPTYRQDSGADLAAGRDGTGREGAERVVPERGSRPAIRNDSGIGRDDNRDDNRDGERGRDEEEEEDEDEADERIARR